MTLDGLRAHVEKRNLLFLEDAKVDYAEDRMGGQLTIRAPKSRMPRIGDDSREPTGSGLVALVPVPTSYNPFPTLQDSAS